MSEVIRIPRREVQYVSVGERIWQDALTLVAVGEDEDGVVKPLKEFKKPESKDAE